MFGGGGGGRGGPFSRSIRSAVEHPALAESLEHYPLLSDENGVPTFAEEPNTIRAQVATPDPEEFDVGPTGQVEDLAFVLIAMESARLHRDDRVYYDSPPDGQQAYRVTAPQPTTMLGTTHIQWALVPDTRGEGASGTGGSDDPSSDDGSDRSGGEYEDGPPLFE